MSYINNEHSHSNTYPGEHRQELGDLDYGRQGQQIMVRQSKSDETNVIRLLWFFAAATTLTLSLAVARLFL